MHTVSRPLVPLRCLAPFSFLQQLRARAAAPTHALTSRQSSCVHANRTQLVAAVWQVSVAQPLGVPQLPVAGRQLLGLVINLDSLPVLAQQRERAADLAGVKSEAACVVC